VQAYIFSISMNTYNKIIRDGALDSSMLDLSFKLIKSVVTGLLHAGSRLNGSSKRRFLDSEKLIFF